MNYTVVESGIVYSGVDAPQYSSCSFPAVCQLRNGTLIASFKAARRKIPDNASDRAAAVFSYDNGKTWSQPAELFEAPVVDGKPTTLRTLYFIEIKEGDLLAVCNAVDATMTDLPYYNEETEGLKMTYILFSHSYDNGKTWEPLERIQVETFRDLPLPLTGAPHITKEGRIGIQFEVNKHYYETEYWVHHSAAVYSEDGGKTWGNEVVITDCPEIYYWDQRISALPDGRVCDIFWTFDRRKGDYINIHYCESHDGGRSYGPLLDTGLSGQPGNVLQTADGALLAIYINRDAAPVIRLARSEDGKVWQDVLTVFDFGKNTKGKENAGMNDVWAEMGAFNIGHPFMTRLNDGTILAHFYSGPSTHRTDFHVVRIEEK
ncbi:MAG: exo-alpha-sialidase [Clostridia bacterium]|nr:exo-alpha-sialidase [Clostridia bacterium]